MRLYIHGSEALSPIKSPQPLHSTRASFPIIVVAIIGILATAFLLVSYYVFVIKCCLNWHRIDVLGRFSFSRRRSDESPLVVSGSPEKRGLGEAAIRSIPIFNFKKSGAVRNNECECSVCLNEFQEEEKLRAIPNCGHVFHIDCIDVWLQSNANCPLCRTSISSNSLDAQFHPLDQMVSLSPSPQDPTEDFTRQDEDYVVIEIGPERERVNLSLTRVPEKSDSGEVSKDKKFGYVSSMGDECIGNSRRDDQFSIQPVRRSFSMDSGSDRQLYLAVEEIIQRRHVNSDVIVSLSEGCSRVNKRSFFSFGQGKSSSRSAVQPVALD